eukprot:gene6138-12426_t
MTFSAIVDTHEDIMDGNCFEKNRCSLRQAFSFCLSRDHSYHRNCSIVLSPNAVVYLNSPISVQSKFHSIRLDGNGSVVIPSNNLSTFGFLNIKECYSFHLHNITISGFSGNHFESIIHIDNVINSSLHNIKFHNNIAAHSHAIVVKNSPYFTVAESHFVDNVISNRGAILSLTNAKNMNIHSNIFEYNSGGINIKYSTTFSMINTIIYGNSAGRGGGIYVTGPNNNVIMNSCLIKRNIVNTDGAAQYNGGGICMYSSNKLFTVINSNIVNNSALSNGGGIFIDRSNARFSVTTSSIAGNRAFFGGGVYVNTLNPMVTIVSSVFSSNIAEFDGGAVYYNSKNIDSYVTDCTFYGNSAANYGGAIFLNKSNINRYMNHIVAHSNQAVNSGGGIYVKSYNHNIVLYKSTLSYNRAGTRVSFGIFSIEGSDDGGAVMLYLNNENFQIYYCNMYGNTATNKGGSVFLSAANNNFFVTHSNISTNSASIGGGLAIGTYNIHVMITKCIFNANYAVDGEAIDVSNKNDYLMISNHIISDNTVRNIGGGLLVSSTQFISTIGCSFLRNIALRNIDGGGLGGGIYIHSCNDISISLTIFDGNTGGSQGGGLAPNGGGLGLGSFNSNGTVFDCIFSSNTAGDISYSSGSSSGLGNGFNGGAIYIGLSNYLFKFIDCNMTDNKADFGGAMSFAGSSSNVVIENVQMTNNHGNVYGGALFIGQYSTGFILHKVIFQSNSAVQKGGSLYLDDYSNDIKMTKCSFRSSHSIQSTQSNGGSVYINSYSSMISVLGCVFDNNIAYSNGGAIYVYQYNSHIDNTDSIFTSNTILNYDGGCGGGGAIYFNDANTFIHITRCSFLSNSAGSSSDHPLLLGTGASSGTVSGSGGAISVSGSANYNISITKSLFSRNHAGDTGGALVLTSLHAFISNYVNGNGHGHGGAVSILMSTPTTTATTTTSVSTLKQILRSCVYYNNSAGYGGAMSVKWGINVDITNNTFNANIATDSTGSAIFLTATTGCTVSHNAFRNNHANQIGSVYWTTKVMSEPEGLSDRGSGSGGMNI